MRMFPKQNLIVMCGLPGCNAFPPTLSNKRHDFREKMYKNGFTNAPQCYAYTYILCPVIIWQHVSNNRDCPQALIKIYERRYGFALIALVSS